VAEGGGGTGVLKSSFDAGDQFLVALAVIDHCVALGFVEERLDVRDAFASDGDDAGGGVSGVFCVDN
jgi:hypothetical protein